MNKVAQALSPEDVLIDIDAANKENLFEDIAQFFEWRHGLNTALVYSSLLARERLGSTGIGNSVAIPHARMKGLMHTIGVFVRMRHSIDFDALDNRPVSMALVLLVPEHVDKEHLEMLATTATMFSDKHFRNQLQQCKTAAAIYQAIFAWSPA